MNSTFSNQAMPMKVTKYVSNTEYLFLINTMYVRNHLFSFFFLHTNDILPILQLHCLLKPSSCDTKHVPLFMQ